MFVSTIKKAHDAVEGVAMEAAFSIVAMILLCGAVLFGAVGAALWLSTVMALHFAFMIIAVLIAAVSGLVYLIGKRTGPSADAPAEASKGGASPLAAMTKSLGSLAGPMDVVASGLFARQFKKAPLSTIAATAAVGALIGIMAQDRDEP